MKNYFLSQLEKYILNKNEYTFSIDEDETLRLRNVVFAKKHANIEKNVKYEAITVSKMGLVSVFDGSNLYQFFLDIKY